MVHFVGAGCGAEDLITVRGQRLISQADVIIYTGSLVNPKLLEAKKPGCAVYDSAKMTLEEVIDLMRLSHKEGKMTVRLHTGDQSIYGAVREQMDMLDALGIEYDSCPGVSSMFGAAASLDMEYTLPGISQSVIITRVEGRTGMPEKEKLSSLASHGSSMVIFLSAGLMDKVKEELLLGGRSADTPAAIVYKATWPDEKKILCTVGTLDEAARENNITKTALVIVGKAVSCGSFASKDKEGYVRSRLYDPSFETGFRKPSPDLQTLNIGGKADKV